MPITPRYLTCDGCSTPIMDTPRGRTRQFCKACNGKRDVERNRRLRAEQRDAAGRAPRACSSCGADISRLRIDAIVCAACRKKLRSMPRKRPGVSIRQACVQSSKVLKKQSSRTPDSSVLRRRTEKKPTAEWPPNFDGDWWEGWNGPYSPGLTPVAIELIEKRIGTFDPSMVKTKRTESQEDIHDPG